MATKSDPKRGLTVALLAPDGGGKSTIAELLRTSLPVEVKVIYMGLYQRPSKSPPFRIPGPGLAVRLIRAWTRYALGRLHQARGRIVVFDRYTYDALLARPEELGLLGRGHRRLLASACPPPDVAILLDADPEVLHARKSDHTVGELAAQREGFLRLTKLRPEILVVDGARPLEEVGLAVKEIVWSAYSGDARR
jgi:hypothetical protein